MSRLPVVSATDLINALGHEGFQVIRQKGSHIVVQKHTPTGTITTVVPNHRELAPGTLRSILKKAGISIEEVIRLLSVILGITVQFWTH